MKTTNNNKETQYKIAKDRVKKIKSFYKHLTVYLIINLFFASRAFYVSGIEGVKQTALSVGLLWGIGLLFHWYATFGKNLFFSNEWEEQKIKELIDG